MSTEISTRRLEPVLRLLAANPEMKVAEAAAKHSPSGVALEEFVLEIWTWLKQFNMGKRQLSPTRISAALAQEPAPKACAPAVKTRVAKILDRAARETKLQPAPAAAVLQHAHEKTTAKMRADSAPNKPAAYPRPWATLIVRRPSYEKWRPILLAAAKNPERPALELCGGDKKAMAALYHYRTVWLGGGDFNTAQITEFITWADAQLTGKPVAAAPSKFPIKPAAPFKFPVKVVPIVPNARTDAAKLRAAALEPSGNHATHNARVVADSGTHAGLPIDRTARLRRELQEFAETLRVGTEARVRVADQVGALIETLDQLGGAT